MLNFESKLEKDLQDTTQSLINKLKTHSLLSNQNIKLMEPVEEVLHDSFAKMRHTKLPANKNYFAMSLKDFFKNLSDD